MTESTRALLEILAAILLRCWILGFALLLVWFGAVLLKRDAIQNLHGPMFDLSGHELALIHYCGMGLLKLCLLTFFLIPWIAIRLVLKKG